MGNAEVGHCPHWTEPKIFIRSRQQAEQDDGRIIIWSYNHNFVHLGDFFTTRLVVAKMGRTHAVGNRRLSDARRRPTGIRTRCKRCNAAEGDVARRLAIVVCPVNTGDLAVFRQIGRPLEKTAVSRWNGRLFSLGRFGGLVNVSPDEAREFATKHIGWLEEQLRKQAARPTESTAWKVGTEIWFRGELVRIETEADRVIRFGTERVATRLKCTTVYL